MNRYYTRNYNKSTVEVQTVETKTEKRSSESNVENLKFTVKITRGKNTQSTDTHNIYFLILYLTFSCLPPPDPSPTIYYRPIVTMDGQFSYLRRRDTSVAMLKVKMSRRLSQNQKENRGRAVDARRQLDNLPEHETNLDTSAVTKTPGIKDITNIKEKSGKSSCLHLTLMHSYDLKTLVLSVKVHLIIDKLPSLQSYLFADKALEEKLKQLARWKERKALQKEKEKQERERKGVFKTGLYHPKDTVFSLPPVPAASRAKEVSVTASPKVS